MSAKKASGYTPVKSGYDPRNDKKGTGVSWMKISAGEVIDAIVLVEAEEILTCEQCAIWLEAGNSPVWVYTGPEDPSHDLSVDRRYRAYLPLLIDSEPAVWSMGKTAHIQLLDIADASGELKGLEIRIKRTGSGLSTRYSIVPKGKRHDVSRHEEIDVVAMLGPITPNEVKAMITEKLGKGSYEEVLASFKGRTKTKRGKFVEEVKKEEEEEDLEEVELL
jgi:hypothetical protein